MIVRNRKPKVIFYPESDGQPMGENTLQVKWIIELYDGFQALFRNRSDVFIAADLFWYPVEGDPRTVLAPDVMLAFGRPKGDRRSYKQWEENDTPPQVVFEILSPGNRGAERRKKFDFYQTHGVEEYYEYDPDRFVLLLWMREGDRLLPVEPVNGWTSPRLGVTFRVPGDAPMTLIGPDGAPFMSYLELLAEHDERLKTVEVEQERARKLAEKLREFGVDPDSIR
jgi:Uma2 family endonuclease